MNFKEIDSKNIKENLISMVDDEWMLVTAGDKNGFNTMTASWGFFGEMWNKECAIAVIRPSRYTYEFMENNEYFSLCFMGDNKEVHKVCGSKSGRDTDKIKETGLKPIFGDNAVYYEQARVVVICRKLYASMLNPADFTDKEVLDSYGGTNYHKAFVGEIVKVLVK